jgi:N-acetylmuramic acid 6-phosphate (MurNAc-6-P) etherase
VDHHEAQRLLDAANGEVKTAIVMALVDVDVDQAHRRLASSAGRVRLAINNG